MFGLGFQEILLLFLLALLLFGAKKLPQIGKSLGNAIKEFKDAFDGKADEKTDLNEKNDDGNK
jgi:sec-independent protein translocase protein TatA